MIRENELRGILQWMSKNSEHREKSRQHHSLDISQVSEDQELRLILPKFIQKPKDLLGIWLWTLSENPIWKEDLRLVLAERCKRNKYKGLWFIIHKLICLNSLNLAVYTMLESQFSGRDLRGNLLPRSKKFYKFIEYKVVEKKKFLKPQFHRGYRDHGGRRLSHEVHDCSTYTGENPESIDLSNKMKKNNFLLNFLYG